MMTKLDGLFHLLVAASLGLLLFCCLPPVTAGAQPLPPPLPLPHITVYGAVTQEGQALAAGAVKALLPNGVAVTATIGAIRGTSYNYALEIPLFMTATTTLSTTRAGVLTGDAITFFVDNQPAFYQDPATRLTLNDLRIRAQGAATTAAARTYAVNLTTRGAEAYPLGDVNANGVRNSADAMLTLKYDIGFIVGVTAFPPGPNTVYLPLCDIVENGRCDSSDALRILQCDVGMSGITCPAGRIAARTRTEQEPAPGAPVALHTVVSSAPDSETVAVQVVLDDPAAEFGAGSLELGYDPSLFAVVGCEENPTGALDLASCNAAYAPGAVRFAGIASAGEANGAPLATIHFRSLGATPTDLNTRFALRAEGVFDKAGEELAWSDGGATPTPDTPTPDTPVPGTVMYNVYIPSVTSLVANAAAVVVTDTVTQTPPLAPGYLFHLPLIGVHPDDATAVIAPPADVTPATAITETAGVTETEVVSATEVVTETAAPALTPAPVQEDDASQPPPTPTPVANLPNKEQPIGSEDGLQLYLPLITEE